MIKSKDFLNQNITVYQSKSSAKASKRQKSCLQGLGLRKIGSSSNLSCTPSIFGMIRSVQHMLKLSKNN